MSVSTQRMELALKFLAETDEDCARLRADHARAEYMAKSVRNTNFAAADGTVADRNAAAENSPEYEAAKLAEFQAFQEYEAMKNKRATESIVIDVWRSLNSARNKGQIV